MFNQIVRHTFLSFSLADQNLHKLKCTIHHLLVGDYEQVTLPLCAFLSSSVE